jgi:hypothetical protein
VSIEDFLGGSIFRYGVFPLLSAGAGILLRCATRNDQYAFLKKEDTAVGPQLMLTAILTYVVLTTDRARDLVEVNRQLSDALKVQPLDQSKVNALQTGAYTLSEHMMSAAWTLVVLIVGLWAVTVIVKRWGWIDEAQLKPTTGIALPLVLGVASLMYVMTAATK